MKLFTNTIVLIIIKLIVLLRPSNSATLLKDTELHSTVSERDNYHKITIEPEHSNIPILVKNDTLNNNKVSDNTKINKEFKTENIARDNNGQEGVLGEIYGNNHKCQSVLPPAPTSGCCGVTALGSEQEDDFNNLLVRSLGGEDTVLEQYPWIAELQYKSDDGRNLDIICSGSLISSRYVVTAAHCVEGLSEGHVAAVRLGALTRISEESNCMRVSRDEEICADGALSIDVDQITVHPLYNDSDLKNDIALIRLKQLAPFTDNIRPICLPSSDITAHLSADLKLDFVGWGAAGQYYSARNDDFIDIRVDERLRVQLPYVHTKECQRIYSAINEGYSVTKNQICAGGEAGRGTCRGDSGGPLMMWGKVAQLLGVNSFGHVKPCGQPDVPAVFTKVLRYRDWIIDVIDWNM